MDTYICMCVCMYRVCKGRFVYESITSCSQDWVPCWDDYWCPCTCCRVRGTGFSVCGCGWRVGCLRFQSWRVGLVLALEQSWLRTLWGFFWPRGQDQFSSSNIGVIHRPLLLLEILQAFQRQPMVADGSRWWERGSTWWPFLLPLLTDSSVAKQHLSVAALGSALAKEEHSLSVGGAIICGFCSTLYNSQPEAPFPPVIGSQRHKCLSGRP